MKNQGISGVHLWRLSFITFFSHGHGAIRLSHIEIEYTEELIDENLTYKKQWKPIRTW